VTKRVHKISYKVAVCLRVKIGTRREHADCCLVSGLFLLSLHTPFTFSVILVHLTLSCSNVKASLKREQDTRS